MVHSRGSRQWFTQIETQRDPRNWQFGNSKYFFFDIDDTLNAHGQGLKLELLEALKSSLPQEARVILLTNCSARRAREHQQCIQGSHLDVELWPVGIKPDYYWLLQALSLRGWNPRECALYGDRPTMDLYLAYQAGFASRVWVKFWGQQRAWKTPLQWTQNLEWALLGGAP